MRVNSREVVPKCTFFTLRSSSRIPMASTYLLYTEEIKIKKSVTDSASFEIGIKIGLRPFSATQNVSFQAVLIIQDPPKVSLSTTICLPLANSCERFAQGGGVPP